MLAHGLVPPLTFCRQQADLAAPCTGIHGIALYVIEKYFSVMWIKICYGAQQQRFART
jgi:hypothetical protein